MVTTIDKPLIVLVGPTASGKSSLALHLATEFSGEIVSCDSVAVYRGFDIGSAKPSAELLKRVPHHLISELSAEAEFSAGKFAKLADSHIAEITERAKTPIICGGTGLSLVIRKRVPMAMPCAP